MRFIDEARIKVKAGDGGPGIVAWRREKFVPLGGPAGGDGGKGGDVIFIAKEGMNSLLEIKRRAVITANDGGKGESKNKTGRAGENKIVFVPMGTQVRDVNHPNTVYDLLSPDQSLSVCKGGDGGFGNTHFKSQYQAAPADATLGFKGEEKNLLLTLKLMADVGLLGMPNAGKSTLLSHLSSAKPKIADYPFTTIKPMVGVCEVDIGKTFVIADIPGLIEGASQGKGLGTRFLRHLERVRWLCHVIDASAEDDLLTRYSIINQELLLYREDLKKLPHMVVLNKMDVVNQIQRAKVDDFLRYLTAQNIMCHTVSAVSGEGLSKLKESLYRVLYPHDKKSAFDPLLKLY